MGFPSPVLLALVALGIPGPEEAGTPPPTGEKPLRDLREGEYRTPRAGEGFRTEVLGREVRVEPRERRKVNAWDLGLAAVAPGISGSEVLPVGSLYFWRRPDEDTFLRVVAVGVYDDLLFARTGPRFRPLELVLSFENYTIPTGQTEVVDGRKQEGEDLLWGRVRGGVGIGYRRQLERPGHNDNMVAVSLLAEPGYFYADDTSDTDPGYVVPEDTFEGRGRLILRLDALERNLLELAHSGYAAGSDLAYGRRAEWDDWGRGGEERASEGREYLAFSAYLKGAGGVPFVRSERHRLLGSLHGGTGEGLDRFSAFQVGGGPTGDEFGANARPLVPGALVQEFTTDRYLVVLGEYRFEPLFFAYLSLRSSVAYLHRRRIKDDRLTMSDDLLSSVGARISSGFAWKTLLQIDYNYSTGVIRKGDFGGHEVMAQLARSF